MAKILIYNANNFKFDDVFIQNISIDA